MASRKPRPSEIAVAAALAVDPDAPIPAQPRPKVMVGPDDHARGGYTVRLKFDDDRRRRGTVIYAGTKRTCNDRAQVALNVLDALVRGEAF